MRKFLFTCIAILYTLPSIADCAFGLLKAELPAETATGPNTKYIQDEFTILKTNENDEIRYLQCGPDGATTNRFVYCSNNSQVLGGDGSIYQCQNNKWIKLDDSQFEDCDFDNIMDRSTSSGSYLIANKNQLDYIFFPNYDQYHKIKNNDICKVALTKYYAEEDNCMFQGGEFLFVGKVCNTSGAHSISVVVKNADGEFLSGASFTYPQMNLPENQNKNIATESGNTYTITVGEYANLTQIKISKEGYDPQILTVKQIQDEKDNIIILDTTGNNPGQTNPEISPNTSRQISQAQERQNAQPITQTGTEYENTNETNLDKKLADAQNALTTARDTENSWANRGLTAASTAATGIGGMQAASAIAEQRADAAAEKQMRDYLATFKCEYDGGQEFNAGNEEITLPGGNELLEYYTEYKTLADNLKTTKAALGLRAGIESETLYDRAESGLYQYATAERKTGGEISLARALSDETSEDAARWAEQKEQTAKQLKTGAIVAGAGIVGGIAGNYLINERGKTKLQQKTDDVIEEIEERLPAFTPQTVVIQNPEEQKPTIYLGENNGRMQMPKLTNLSPRTKELTLNGDTTFARNSDKIKSDGTKKIDTFVTELKPILEEMSDEQKIKINIVGHTDRTGNDKINIPLSQRRAESVKKYLEEPNRLGGNAYKTKIEYSTDGRGSSECADNTCGDKKDCELCRKVVVTIEDISPKTEETE
ncbi:MAG: OmpA family protein [Alphaproteobacteria bacterium]|nr:OmpA family protein [Alphaproteobacteria bacterium]